MTLDQALDSRQVIGDRWLTRRVKGGPLGVEVTTTVEEDDTAAVELAVELEEYPSSADMPDGDETRE